MKSLAKRKAMQGMMLLSLAHGSDEPFFIGGESPKRFTVTTQIPLVGDFVLAVWQAVKTFALNQHPLTSAKSSVTFLLPAFL